MSGGAYPGDILATPAPASENPPAVAFTRPGQATEGSPSQAETPAAMSYSPIVGYIRSQWNRSYRAKQDVERRLLACLRARRAQYAPPDYQMYTRNGVGPPYLPLAAVKMRAAEAAITELLLPDGDRPWGLDPSPIPELPPQIQISVQNQAYAQAQQILQQSIQQAQQGQGQPMDKQDYFLLELSLLEKANDDALELLRKEATERANRMEDEIEQRMREGDYYAAARQFVSHFVTYPAAILKGPFLRMKRRMVWKWSKPEVVYEPTLCWSVVNPFDAFPAQQASSTQNGDFIERMRFERADLFEMIGLPGYDEQAIRRVLALHLNGNLQSWLWAEIERRQIEADSTEVWKPAHLIDALHYWGRLSGQDLIAHGVSDGIDDPQAYYDVDCILIDNEIIRCEINQDPLRRRPYWSTSYDPVPGAFWGNSIYELMADCQDMANAAFRALNANMGLASGPIMGIDISKLAAGEDPKAIAPLSVVQLDLARSSTADAEKALIFWQADSRAVELTGLIQQFKQEADDLTGIPRYMYGNEKLEGGASTASGLSMLMGTAAKGLRRAVANIDLHVISPTIQLVYEHEMLYGKNPMAKGDCVVSARGSAAVLIKEHLQNARTQFLALVSGNDRLYQIIGQEGLRAVLEEVSTILDMPKRDVVPSAEQLQKKTELMAQTPPQPSPDAKIKAQTEKYKVDSHKEETGVKVAASLAKEGMIHPGARPVIPPPEQAPQAQPAPDLTGLA